MKITAVLLTSSKAVSNGYICFCWLFFRGSVDQLVTFKELEQVMRCSGRTVPDTAAGYTKNLPPPRHIPASTSELKESAKGSSCRDDSDCSAVKCALPHYHTPPTGLEPLRQSGAIAQVRARIWRHLSQNHVDSRRLDEPRFVVRRVTDSRWVPLQQPRGQCERAILRISDTVPCAPPNSMQIVARYVARVNFCLCRTRASTQSKRGRRPPRRASSRST